MCHGNWVQIGIAFFSLSNFHYLIFVIEAYKQWANVEEKEFLIQDVLVDFRLIASSSHISQTYKIKISITISMYIFDAVHLDCDYIKKYKSKVNFKILFVWFGWT